MYPPPPAPRNLSATAGDGEVLLEWDVHPYDVLYEVQQSDDDGRTFNGPAPGTFSVQITKGATKATAKITGLTNGAEYHHRVRASNNTGQSPWSLTGATIPVAILNAPTGLDVTPMGLRKARLTWTGDSRAEQYTIQVQDAAGMWQAAGNSNSEEYVIELNDVLKTDGLADEDEFRIQVIAKPPTTGTSPVKQSNASQTIIIRDNPLLLKGGSADGKSPGPLGQANLEWARITGATSYTVEYRKLGKSPEDKSHWDVDWPRGAGWPYYETNPNSPDEVPQPGSGNVEHPIDRLDPGQIYAIQVNYTLADGAEVFSARDAYVSPWGGFPGEALFVPERVATFPYFGHWPDREYRYAVCDYSFPTGAGVQSDWTDLINHAFKQWEFATGEVTITPLGSTDCEVDPDVPMSIMRSIFNDVNEVFMVDTDDTKLAEAVILHLGDIGLDFLQSQSPLALWPGESKSLFLCVYGAPACVISQEYPGNNEASTRLELGDVDVLINEQRIGTYQAPPGHDDSPSRDDTQFNTCKDNSSGPMSSTTGTYVTLVHEAGHALGLSGYDFTLLVPLTGYEMAHATIPDSVMNYQSETNIPEPDCFPHPFDIMAIKALYQSLPRP